MNKWSFKKPVNLGLYLCNYGDLVVAHNISAVKVSLNTQTGDYYCLYSGLKINSFSSSCKWLEVDINELNLLSNE